MKVLVMKQGQTQATTVELEDGSTIADLREEMELASHFIGKINGVDANDETVLSDWKVVTFAEKIKGA